MGAQVLGRGQGWRALLLSSSGTFNSDILLENVPNPPLFSTLRPPRRAGGVQWTPHWPPASSGGPHTARASPLGSVVPGSASPRMDPDIQQGEKLRTSWPPHFLTQTPPHCQGPPSHAPFLQVPRHLLLCLPCIAPPSLPSSPISSLSPATRKGLGSTDPQGPLYRILGICKRGQEKKHVFIFTLL